MGLKIVHLLSYKLFMGRPIGKRNAGYVARRRALALAAAGGLVNAQGEPGTLKDLAEAANVSVPTIKHYFQDRDGAIQAALAATMETIHDQLLANPINLKVPAEDALIDFFRRLAQEWRTNGLGRIHAAALSLGLGHPQRGPIYIDQVLDPILALVEAHLRRRVGRGELRLPSTRYGAQALTTPILFALLHQDHLGGARHHPIDLDDFIAAHVRLVLGGCRV